jgi:hypothetical protein
MVGSTNLKCSNVVDHAKSEVHKAAMSRQKSDSARASGKSVMLSTPIARCLAPFDDETQARLRRRFDVCYVMAKKVAMGLNLILPTAHQILLSCSPRKELKPSA